MAILTVIVAYGLLDKYEVILTIRKSESIVQLYFYCTYIEYGTHNMRSIGLKLLSYEVIYKLGMYLLLFLKFILYKLF